MVPEGGFQVIRVEVGVGALRHGVMHASSLCRLAGIPTLCWPVLVFYYIVLEDDMYAADEGFDAMAKELGKHGAIYRAPDRKLRGARAFSPKRNNERTARSKVIYVFM